MSIVCATDLLPKSDVAIDRAALLADELGTDVTLLHVVLPIAADRVLEQTLDMALTQMHSRVQPPHWRGTRIPSVEVRAGNASRRIVDTLEQTSARLLVLGTHRKRRLRDTLEGTVAEKALAARKCPLLVVQNPAREPYRRVLLGLDVSDASASAIRAVESLVLTPEADAQILHAYEPPYSGMLQSAGVEVEAIGRYADAWTREAALAIRGLLMIESTDPRRYDIRVGRGQPASALLRAIEDYRPDLLVMGTRGGGRLHRALLGSVANRVLHEAACDVLIVPEGTVARPKELGDVRVDRRTRAAG